MHTDTDTLETLANEARANGGTLVLFDHAQRGPEELNAAVVQLAVDVGWRLADPQDYADAMALLLLVAELPLSDVHPPWAREAERERDERGTLPLGTIELLEGVADDAETWLNEQGGPFSLRFYHDGEVGAFFAEHYDPDDLTMQQAEALLAEDGGMVPCSRYGRSGWHCAPVAAAVAYVVARETGGSLSEELAEECMGLVVNDSDDPELTLRLHGPDNGIDPMAYLEAFTVGLIERVYDAETAESVETAERQRYGDSVEYR